MPPRLRTADVRKLCDVLREYQKGTSARIILNNYRIINMIWNEKQADILIGHKYFMTECPTTQESSQSICRENRLVCLFMIRAFIMKISKLFGALLFS